MEAGATGQAAENGSVAESPAAAKAALDLKQAETRKTGAEADKAAQEALKASLEAQKASQEAEFPTPTSTRPEGKLEVGEGVGLVADLLAHSLLDAEAGRLAEEVHGDLHADARLLLVTDRALAAGDWPHRTVSDGLAAFDAVLQSAGEGIERAGGAMPPEPPKAKGTAEAAVDGFVPGASAASALVGGVADAVGWLRADYSLTARQVTIGEAPLLATLAGHLTAKGLTADVDGFALLGSSAQLDRYKNLVRRRHAIKAAAQRLQAEVVDPATRLREARLAELKEVVTAMAKSLGSSRLGKEKWEELNGRLDGLQDAALDGDRDAGRAQAAVTTANEVVAGFDGFAATILAAPASGSGYPPLLAAALRERLHDDDSPYTHVLYANLESAGGEAIAKRWLWSDPKLRFLGGAQFSYLIYSREQRKLVKAGTVPLLGSIRFSLRAGSLGEVRRVNLKALPRSSPRPWGFGWLRRLMGREAGGAARAT